MITLRDATMFDALMLYRWRNDLSTRSMFRNTHKVSWDQHTDWLSMALDDSDYSVKIAMKDKKAVGVITTTRNGDVMAISITVDPKYRNNGIGKKILDLVCQVGTYEAEVKTENEASKKLFLSCGFEHVGQRNGLELYRLVGK